MKKFITVLICFFTLINYCGCSIKQDENSIKQDENSIKQDENYIIENQIIDMFITYGEHNNGDYYFRKYETIGNLSFSYSFVYSPKNNLFRCSLLTTNHISYEIYTYGLIIFSWGNIKNGSFYGYNELENIAIIEFLYSFTTFNKDITFGENYTYEIISNTYVNLTEQTDIDLYAKHVFDCINQSVGYAQSIIILYLDTIYLW